MFRPLTRLFPFLERTTVKLRDDDATKWPSTSQNCQTWCRLAAPWLGNRTSWPSCAWPSPTWSLWGAPATRPQTEPTSRPSSLNRSVSKHNHRSGAEEKEEVVFYFLMPSTLLDTVCYTVSGKLNSRTHALNYLKWSSSFFSDKDIKSSLSIMVMVHFRSISITFSKCCLWLALLHYSFMKPEIWSFTIWDGLTSLFLFFLFSLFNVVVL